MTETTGAVTDAFTALTDPVRRYVLYYLTNQEAPVSFDSLTTQAAAWDTDSEPDAVDDETLAEVRTALYHVHLPKLADLGVITYEANPGEIALTDDTDSLDPFLEPARQADLGTGTPTEQV
ncbi:DUF7344 domain-containing protein [Natronomonas salsuginis]|uniref:DUF7344 domain-containing protein n=1 Tax=Natronomonas salsuginis TaxID=2217661 RepID=A0A4U5JES4_9EURY|nr:hypothetical protein [Natronomonas salsuginis]TKR27960.1 hypothetical protein DM868_02450 [Natronomonas salsuginis]